MEEGSQSQGCNKSLADTGLFQCGQVTDLYSREIPLQSSDRLEVPLRRIYWLTAQKTRCLI